MASDPDDMKEKVDEEKTKILEKKLQEGRENLNSLHIDYYDKKFKCIELKMELETIEEENSQLTEKKKCLMKLLDVKRICDVPVTDAEAAKSDKKYINQLNDLIEKLKNEEDLFTKTQITFRKLRDAAIKNKEELADLDKDIDSLDKNLPISFEKYNEVWQPPKEPNPANNFRMARELTKALEEMKQAVEEVTRLKAELDALERQVNVEQETLNLLNNNYNALKQKREGQEKEIQDMSLQIECHKNEVQKLEELVAKQKYINVKLEDENRSIEVKLKERKESLEAPARKKDDYLTTVKNNYAKVRNINAEIEKKKLDLSQLEWREKHKQLTLKNAEEVVKAMKKKCMETKKNYELIDHDRLDCDKAAVSDKYNMFDHRSHFSYMPDTLESFQKELGIGDGSKQEECATNKHSKPRRCNDYRHYGHTIT